ncbi:MAG: epoxyqueuosine reductase [Candidatus Izemoplasmatales bacterium]
MNINNLHQSFQEEFDIVGIIKTDRYFSEAKKLNLKLPITKFPTMVVLGLSYPKRIKTSTKTELYASFYTFGTDYHQVLKNRIIKVMNKFPLAYELGVDNHPYDERLAALLAGIGFFGKNQLIINQTFGSYIFLGIVFIDLEISEEFTLPIIDNCGSCRICLDACPTKALNNDGYDFNKCISYYNQEKKVLSSDEIKANYCLFGCDICQLVCPKNLSIKPKLHPEFELSGKEGVNITDLFTYSEKEFIKKYQDMAYLWKGKTILMRNALTLLLRSKNFDYNDLVKRTIDKQSTPWYHETALKIIEELEQIKKESTLI